MQLININKMVPYCKVDKVHKYELLVFLNIICNHVFLKHKGKYN